MRPPLERWRRFRLFRRFLFSFAGYAVLAYLAHLNAVDQGTLRICIAAPAAGLALAVVLAWGYEMVLAIALGAFAIRFGVEHAGGAGGLAIAIAAGFQAASGAALIRFVGSGFQGPMGSASDLRRVAITLATGLTLGSVFVPTAILLTKVGASLGAGETGFLWTLRWSSEAIGCLVFTPLTLLWIARDGRTSANRWLTSGLIIAVLGGFFAVAYFWNRSESDLISASFESRTVFVEQAIRKYTTRTLETVRAIAQFADAKGNVSREEFGRFVRPFFDRQAGVRAYEWTSYVRDADRAAFERRVRRDGYAKFEIHQSVSPGVMVRRAVAPEYFPITYIEPVAGNEVALGYDVAWTPGESPAIHLARDSGNVALSEPITLVQERESQRAVVGFYPIYRGGPKIESVEARRKNLIGLVEGVFRMGELVEAALAGLDLEGMTIRLDDLKQGDPTCLYDLARTGEVRTSFAYSNTFGFENQNWRLSTSLTTRGLHAYRHLGSWVFPIGGIFFASVTLFMILLLTGRSAEVESLIVERTSELRTALRARDDFLSMASHELKTPLTPLRLQVEFLRSRIQDGRIAAFTTGPDFSSFVESLVREVGRFSRLVDDLLDISRLSAGKLRLDPSESDLGKIAKDVTQDFSRQLQNANCKVEVSVRGNPVGYWDPHRIHQVVINLVSNAAKYGAGNPIQIEVVGDERESRLTITDRGIGIAEHDRAKIFGRFVRVVPVQNYAGLGLGLFIAREILTAHGGSISVDSTLGHGSTFTVVLPAHFLSESPA